MLDVIAVAITPILMSLAVWWLPTRSAISGNLISNICE
jgi:hypothetical protein